VGRLTDPKNPHFNEHEARQWKIINFPAIAQEEDPLGRKPGEALWPERFGLDYLNGFKQRNPRGFYSLFQQSPSPDNGDLFTKDMIVKYDRKGTPALDQLRVYVASDHAVSEGQRNDKTCIIVVGVDRDDIVWVLDVWWQKAKSDVAVAAMIDVMKKYKPLKWWAEGGHISKSIGPFLKKQMRREKVYVTIDEKHPSADKQQRAQSIIGRMSMHMVRFPKFRFWMADAEDELLKFPNAAHDDFVDALALVGLGLDKMLTGKGEGVRKTDVPAVGTFAWIKYDAAYRSRRSAKSGPFHGGM
jgi:predicted phage terminase large subunit-like protein